MAVEVPETHFDLTSDDSKALAILATIMPDGSPHATPIWFDMRDGMFRFNTSRGRVKDRNLQQNRKVSLTILDPDDDYHWLLVRGEIVDETEEGAVKHINQLAQKYRGKGFNVPEGNVRVMYTVKPNSIFAR